MPRCIVALTATTAASMPLALLTLLYPFLGAPLLLSLGAQRVVPVLRAGRGPLALDSLGAGVRLRHLLPERGAAGVVVEAALHERPPGPTA